MPTVWRLLAISVLVTIAIPSVRVQGSARQLGVLVGVAGDSGRPLFRSETPGPAHLLPTFASGGVVVAERRGCFSADGPNPDGSTVLVGYDSRTGRERWHRAGLVTNGLQSGGWAGLTPGVLPVRDPATDERMGLNSRTGDVVWSRGVESDSLRASTPDLLVTSGAGLEGDRVNGVDRTSGATRWSYEVDGHRHMQLVGADGDLVAMVVVDPPAASLEAASDAGAGLHLLSAQDGRLQREIPLALTIPEQLAMTAIEVIDSTVVLDMGELVAFDAATGDRRWRAPGRIDPRLPSAESDVLLAGSGGGPGSSVSITALDPSTGRRRWTLDLGPSSYGAAAAGPNLVVFGRASYRALDLSTGRLRWSLDAPRGTGGVTGMSGRNFYLAGGCPLTRAD